MKIDTNLQHQNALQYNSFLRHIQPYTSALMIAYIISQSTPSRLHSFVDVLAFIQLNWPGKRTRTEYESFRLGTLSSTSENDRLIDGPTFFQELWCWVCDSP